MLDPYSHMTRDRESNRDAYSNFVVPGLLPVAAILITAILDTFFQAAFPRLPHSPVSTTAAIAATASTCCLRCPRASFQPRTAGRAAPRQQSVALKECSYAQLQRRWFQQGRVPHGIK